MDDTLQSTVAITLILLLLVFACAVLVERVKLPYTIALLLATRRSTSSGLLPPNAYEHEYAQLRGQIERSVEDESPVADE